MGWHLSASGAFHDILVEPMRAHADITLTEWDGQSVDGFVSSDSPIDQPMIFCMRPPPEVLWGDASRRMVWIPMLDNIVIRRYSERWWQALPKTLKVIALSEAVAQKCRALGLRTLSMKYFPDPAGLDPADWNGPRVMFYWNRSGLVPAGFLARMCRELAVDRLLFRPDLDAGIPARKVYSLPSRIGATVVETLAHIDSKEAYLKATNTANIFLAPRGCEGVGLTFIEAMSRGCAVFAHDGGTMNEYIRHRANGYLFQRARGLAALPTTLENVVTQWSPFHRRVHGYPFGRRQNWGEIRSLDLRAIGQTASGDAREGHDQWRKHEEPYADFLLKW